MFINGVAIGAIGLATGPVDRGTQTAAAINAKSSQTGVTATASTATGIVTLLAADGRNITVSSTVAGGDGTGLKSTVTGTAPTGRDAASVAAGSLIINGVTIGAVGTAASALSMGILMAAAINLSSASSGVVATNDATSGVLTLNVRAGVEGTAPGIGAAGGIEISGSDLAVWGLTAGNSVTTAGIQLSTQGKDGIVLGGTTGTTSTGQAGAGFNASVLSSTGGVDLSTAAGSQAALTVLDKAINTITDSRASMGAYQNRLTASVANLETTSMNMQASRSRILDTDYAKETTNLARSQIIQQAATAMLAQANQSAQSVLALLK